MPQLTSDEAFRLLRTFATRAEQARRDAEAAREERDTLVRTFDGQEGMGRTAMAEACGISRMALWKILDRGPEAVEEDVLMSDSLRQALQAVLESVELGDDDRIRLDVHA